ncbi:MAG: response regulator [Verrucomicrobiota bacterium]|jgi:two-component system, response regulator
MPKNQTILLVEDLQSDVLLTQRVFQVHAPAYDLHAVSNGESAMKYLQHRNKDLPKLILLDLKLPGISGFELLKWIHCQPERLRNVPIVILSGSKNVDDAKTCQHLGAKAYLVKPISPEALKQMLQQLCPETVPVA